MRCPSADPFPQRATRVVPTPTIYTRREITPARAGGLFSNENTGANGWANGLWKGPFTYRPVESTKMAEIRDGTSNTIFFSEILGQSSGGDCRAWGRVACNTFSPHTNSASDQWIVGPNADTSASTNLYDAHPIAAAALRTPIVTTMTPMATAAPAIGAIIPGV